MDDELSETSLDVFCGPLVAEDENCEDIAPVDAIIIALCSDFQIVLRWNRITLGGFSNGYYLMDLDS